MQQDVIGQNLADITHPKFAAEIKDSLKPSVILPTSMTEDITISQYRQFFIRMVPNVSYSTFPSHSVRYCVCVCIYICVHVQLYEMNMHLS